MLGGMARFIVSRGCQREVFGREQSESAHVLVLFPVPFLLFPTSS